MPKITKLNDLEKQSQIIKGSWKLDSKHRLSYSSQSRVSSRYEEYSWETVLIEAQADKLVLALTQKQDDGSILTSLAQLNGTWQANKNNQLEFAVKRQSGKSDVLTFTGNWKAGKNNELIYEYRMHDQKKKSSRIHTLVFKGYWDITEKSRLTYWFEGDSQSAFHFKAALQTPSILAKKGEIRYQLGAAGSRSKTGRKTVTLFGKWKLSNKLELVFEMDYGGGEKHAMRFGAEFAVKRNLTVAAKLINRRHEPLGAEILLTRDFLDAHAQAFLRAQKTGREKSLEAGVTIPW